MINKRIIWSEELTEYFYYIFCNYDQNTDYHYHYLGAESNVDNLKQDLQKFVFMHHKWQRIVYACP